MFLVFQSKLYENNELIIPCKAVNLDEVEYCDVENVFDNNYGDKVIQQNLHFIFHSNEGKKTARELVLNNFELENNVERIFDIMFEAYAKGEKVFYL